MIDRDKERERSRRDGETERDSGKERKKQLLG